LRCSRRVLLGSYYRAEISAIFEREELILLFRRSMAATAAFLEGFPWVYLKRCLTY
jgi:hypothetical protein